METGQDEEVREMRTTEALIEELKTELSKFIDNNNALRRVAHRVSAQNESDDGDMGKEITPITLIEELKRIAISLRSENNDLNSTINEISQHI